MGRWVIVDKTDPIAEEDDKGGGIVEFSREMPGALTWIDKYPETVVYGFYLIRNPDPGNLARLRDGDFNCRDDSSGTLRRRAPRPGINVPETAKNTGVGRRGPLYRRRDR